MVEAHEIGHVRGGGKCTLHHVCFGKEDDHLKLNRAKSVSHQTINI